MQWNGMECDRHRPSFPAISSLAERPTATAPSPHHLAARCYEAHLRDHQVETLEHGPTPTHDPWPDPGLDRVARIALTPSSVTKLAVITEVEVKEPRPKKSNQAFVLTGSTPPEELFSGEDSLCQTIALSNDGTVAALGCNGVVHLFQLGDVAKPGEVVKPYQSECPIWHLCNQNLTTPRYDATATQAFALSGAQFALSFSVPTTHGWPWAVQEIRLTSMF